MTAVITDTTLQALPAILDPSQDGYHDTDTPQPSQPTAPAAMKELASPPITPFLGFNLDPLSLHETEILHEERVGTNGE